MCLKECPPGQNKLIAAKKNNYQNRISRCKLRVDICEIINPLIEVSH